MGSTQPTAQDWSFLDGVTSFSIGMWLYFRAAGFPKPNVLYEILRVNKSPGAPDETAMTRRLAFFGEPTLFHFSVSHSLSPNEWLNIPFTFTPASWYYLFTSYKAADQASRT